MKKRADAPKSLRLRIAAVWVAAGLFDISQGILWARLAGKQLSWLPICVLEVGSWLPWAFATGILSRLARRFPMARDMTLRAVAVHLMAFVAVSLVAAASHTAINLALNPWGMDQPSGSFTRLWLQSFLDLSPTFAVVYALILTVSYAIESRENIVRQQIEAVRLSDQLVRAELAALRRQIEPHFMFNALNSIAGLVRDHRNDAAVGMIVGFSEFLRRASEDSHRSQVTLAEEVEYLQRYLDIQKVRFGDRLKVTVDIPAELLQAEVPYLLLQPLVENAIKHGVAKRVAGGSIQVSGERRERNLHIGVRNDGPQLPADGQSARVGIGIGNLRTRLQILHGSKSDLQLRNAMPEGVEVTVVFPFKEA
ncbi:MAG: histidine kinase [Burkholderiaceae bacterium]|jgi:sensor histidine kinase YesM